MEDIQENTGNICGGHTGQHNVAVIFTLLKLMKYLWRTYRKTQCCCKNVLVYPSVMHVCHA